MFRLVPTTKMRCSNTCRFTTVTTSTEKGMKTSTTMDLPRRVKRRAGVAKSIQRSTLSTIMTTMMTMVTVPTAVTATAMDLATDMAAMVDMVSESTADTATAGMGYMDMVDTDLEAMADTAM